MIRHPSTYLTAATTGTVIITTASGFTAYIFTASGSLTF
jgi:hypothetical protein